MFTVLRFIVYVRLCASRSASATGAVAEKDLVIVEVRAKRGGVGWGEASPMSGSFYSDDTPNGARRAGGRVVVGSHSAVPHAERGWAYQRELELLVESGLTPMQAIVAGTMENARFFRIAERLGSIEAGKLADLVLVEGDPLKDISTMRRVKRVMLNGRWEATGAGEN